MLLNRLQCAGSTDYASGVGEEVWQSVWVRTDCRVGNMCDFEMT